MDTGHIITCPSGLSGRIRGMKVKEEQILTDRKLAKTHGQSDALLKACFLELTSAAPYDFTDAVSWDRVLQSDRLYVLLQIRVATHGPSYGFGVDCQNAACRAKIEWELDLNELPMRPMSDETRSGFVRGNEFFATLPGSGTRVSFRLPVGADERLMAQLRRQSQDRVLSAMLAHQIIHIEGVETSVRAYVEDLSMGDADFLLEEFDRLDFGVETAIDIECSECQCEQEVELPFDQTFFLPSRSKKSRHRSRSTSSARATEPTSSNSDFSSSGEIKGAPDSA